MKGLKEFIIKLEKPLNETFKTESGIEMYADKDFSVDRLSNRVATVKAVPIFVDTPVKVGYEVMIEPTILYKQVHRGVRQGYTSLIDVDDNLFKITPNMVILYRETKDDTWKGHLQNLMIEQIEEEQVVVKTSLLLPDNAKPKYKKGVAKVLYVNQELKETGIENGDMIYIVKSGGVNFWLEGKHYWWVRSRDVYGGLIKDAV